MDNKYTVELKPYYLIEVVADMNDADYITQTSTATLERFEVIHKHLKRAATALKVKDKKWCTSEYARLPNPFEMYNQLLSEFEIELIDDLTPFGEHGVHRIASIKIYKVTGETKLI